MGMLWLEIRINQRTEVWKSQVCVCYLSLLLLLSLANQKQFLLLPSNTDCELTFSITLHTVLFPNSILILIPYSTNHEHSLRFKNYRKWDSEAGDRMFNRLLVRLKVVMYLARFGHSMRNWTAESNVAQYVYWQSQLVFKKVRMCQNCIIQGGGAKVSLQCDEILREWVANEWVLVWRRIGCL